MWCRQFDYIIYGTALIIIVWFFAKNFGKKKMENYDKSSGIQETETSFVGFEEEPDIRNVSIITKIMENRTEHGSSRNYQAMSIACRSQILGTMK